MGDANWTKGPWKVVEQQAGFLGHPESMRPQLAVVQPFNGNGPDTQVCEFEIGRMHAEVRANASLIAAAPDLAEALREILEDATAWPAAANPHSAALEIIAKRARAALARARGQEVAP